MSRVLLPYLECFIAYLLKVRIAIFLYIERTLSTLMEKQYTSGKYIVFVVLVLYGLILAIH